MLNSRWLMLFAACTAAATLTAAPQKTAKPPKSPWTCHLPSNLSGSFRLESHGPGNCTVFAERKAGDPKKAYCAAITNINREMWSHNKVVFSVRSLDGKTVSVTPLISHNPTGSKKKTPLISGPKLAVSGKAWRDCVLGLDSDFKLGDAGYFIKQLKFNVGIGDWKNGEKGGIELKNVRICQAAEVSFGNQKAGELIVVRNTPVVPAVPVKDALKIYFAFDNEDHDVVINDRKVQIKDTPDCGGFREVLLENAGGKAVETLKLNEAELIVYAACRPFGKRESAKIAAKVKAGTPLYVASEIADPAIADLLPCTVMTPEFPGLPVRSALQIADKKHPVVKNGGFNDAAFGKYHQITLRSGSKVIFQFADGTPAVIEGKAGKGKVIYNSLSFGADVIPGKKAFDPFFLRIASYLGGKVLPEEPLVPVLPDRDGWYEGVSKNNFGRFGFEVGDGLTVGAIGTKLAVSNGVSEYEFSTEAKEKINLPDWKFTSPEKRTRKLNFCTAWPELGVSTLETQTVIPAEWKGKKLFFYVEKGIDDTADVWFNGQKIGSITKDVPQYWMTPHRHLIPENLVRFGQVNQVKVVTENLKGTGSFNSCPSVIVDTPAKTLQLAVDRINCLGKGGRVMEKGKNLYRFDTSLAFPGTRWEFAVPSVVMSLYNVASFAAYPAPDGVKVADLSKTETLPVNWNAPWLLLFNGTQADNPLLVVFQHRLKNLKVNRSGDSVNGLEFTAPGRNIGAVIPVWIGGSAPVDASRWHDGIPQSLLKKINFWYPRALHFPERVTEKFRLQKSAERIEICDTFGYLDAPDDWKTPVRDYAPVSPLAFFTNGMLFESQEAVRRDLPTGFGYFADRDNADTVHWSLPLPEPDHSLLPHVKGFPEIEKVCDEIFVKAFRYSAGGHVRYESRNLAYPMEKKRPRVKNCNMHSSLLGISQITENPFFYNPENWEKILERFTVRALFPLERAQYKMVSRWRVEPFSGIRYTNYMRSPRDIATRFEPGFGTTITYGDSNETVQMMLTAYQRAADRLGQYDLVKANWNALSRHIPLFPLVEDDWVMLTSACLDYGGSASIDMLNCEYSSMMKLFRLAEIAGDEAVQAQALYRAARRMVPSIARLTIRNYAQQAKLVPDADKILISSGFNENGTGFLQKGARVRSLQLFDMSQGTPRDLLNLYRQYGLTPIRRDYFPAVRAQIAKDDQMPLISALAELDDTISDKELYGLMRTWLGMPAHVKKYTNDWPGIYCGSYFEYVLHRLKGNPVISSAKMLFLKKAVYDPETKILVLDFEAGKNAELVVKSTLKLRSGGKQNTDGSIKLDVSKPGAYHRELRFQ